MTKNLWTQQEHPVVEWKASLDVLGPAPESIAQVLLQVASLGRQSSVVLLDDGLADQFAAVIASRKTFRIGFGGPQSACAAELCWYDGTDEISCGVVDDLGEVLSDLPMGEDKINAGYRELGRPPVLITGSTLSYRDDRWIAGLGGVNLRIQLCSDIWLPYVRGFAHPRRRDDLFFDNTELASRNTPRLNDFLVNVATLMRALGTELVQTEKDAGCILDYQPWVHDTGIALGGPVPNVAPPELVAAEWPATYRED